MTNSARDRQEQAAEEARRWIARMAAGDMQPEELTQFRSWRSADLLHNRSFEEARAIWRATEPVPRQAEPTAPFLPASTQRPWLASPTRRLVATGLTVSIVAALAFGQDIGVLLRADHRTGTVVESITLADGSRVMLNAGAAIAVSYDDKERRIELLRGDAWFEVAHGDRRPFRVAALGGETQDVGTAFEVRHEEQAVSVGVTEGVVEVRSRSDREGQLLRASQSARYSADGPVTATGVAAVDTIAAWRQGEILFDRAAVRTAIGEIGQYRSGPIFIVGTPSSERRVSGAFRTDRVDEVIDAVAGMGGYSVARLGPIAVLRPAE
jgi:transmembrane sensor